MKTVYVRIDVDDDYDYDNDKSREVDVTRVIEQVCSGNGIPKDCVVIDDTETVSNTRRIAEGLLEIALLMESELERINRDGKSDCNRVDKLLESLAKTGVISEAENLLERNSE